MPFQGTPFQSCISRRISTPVGMHKTVATTDGQVQSNVDELYRFSLGLEGSRTFGGDSARAAMREDRRGWTSDTWRNLTRLSVFGTDDGKRNAFVRIPERRISIIILTDSDVDARAISTKIAERLIPFSQ